VGLRGWRESGLLEHVTEEVETLGWFLFYFIF
jgi:hypothetical protein